tara:strand:- start:1166 stop:1348 length:183 start_codon:yes stop_codon:yes gene_type:complete
MHTAGKMMKKDTQFNLRIPTDLLDTVRETSKKNRRSATAEFITLVEEGLKWRKQREQAEA